MLMNALKWLAVLLMTFMLGMAGLTVAVTNALNSPAREAPAKSNVPAVPPDAPVAR